MYPRASPLIKDKFLEQLQHAEMRDALRAQDLPASPSNTDSARSRTCKSRSHLIASSLENKSPQQLRKSKPSHSPRKRPILKLNASKSSDFSCPETGQQNPVGGGICKAETHSLWSTPRLRPRRHLAEDPFLEQLQYAENRDVARVTSTKCAASTSQSSAADMPDRSMQSSSGSSTTGSPSSGSPSSPWRTAARIGKAAAAAFRRRSIDKKCPLSPKPFKPADAPAAAMVAPVAVWTGVRSQTPNLPPGTQSNCSKVGKSNETSAVIITMNEPRVVKLVEGNVLLSRLRARREKQVSKAA